MSTKLDEIIDGSSDSTVRITDLLRRTIVLAHRLQAPALRSWAERELSGYEDEALDDLPLYRRTTSAAKLKWNGPMGSMHTQIVTTVDAPDEFAPLFDVRMREPLSQLEAQLQSEGDLGIPWPAAALIRWNNLAAQGKALSISYMVIHGAHTIVQRSLVEGLLDAVRTQLLTLALDLQEAGGDVGETGGATAADPKVESAVTTFITNVYGPGATVAQGERVRQTVVQLGDLAALTKAASEVGLDGEAAGDFIAAVLEARSDPKRSKLQRFVTAVRSGAVSLSGGVASNIAADQLLELAGRFLGS